MLIYLTFIYLMVYVVYVYVCAVPVCRRCAPMCGHMWKLEVDSAPLFLSFSTLVFKAGSLTGPRAHRVG